MSKKFSDVFNKIKYAKLDPKHNKPHIGGSTDDEEHGAVSELEFSQQVAHAKKRSMTEAETLDEISKSTLVSYTRKASLDMANKQGESQKPSTPLKKSAELLNKGTKRFQGIIRATRKLGEESEQLDEISDELAKKVRDKRTEQGRSWRQNPKWALKSSKNFSLNMARDARKRKNRVPSPEEIKYSKDSEELRNYNKKMGYSNESTEVFGELIESKKTDIVRNAFEKAKNKKKNEKSDNDVSGKVEKFQPDPEMTNTIEKQ